MFNAAPRTGFRGTASGWPDDHNDRVVDHGLSSPSLIGRVAELETLRTAYVRALRGEPRFVVLGGEAGIGKTRLVHEFLRHLPADEALPLIGFCPPQSAAELPYAPIADALQDLVKRSDSPNLAATFGPAAGVLRRIVPDIPLDRASSDDGLPVAPTSQLAIFEALLGVLERLAQDHPVVLVLEDLHWSDPSTRDWLAFLSRSLRRTRALIILIYRSDDLTPEHPWERLLGQLTRAENVVHVALQPLGASEVEQLVAAIAGHLIEAGRLARIIGRADGNPYFAEELAAGSDGRDELPNDLHAVLLARIRALPGPAAEVVRIAAVAGREVQDKLLAAIIDVPSPVLSTALRSATDHQILEAITRDGVDLYRFRHALLREAALADALPRDRRTIHAAIARILEAQPGLVGGGDLDQAVAIAGHWVGAGDADRARPALLRAASSSAAAYAFREADELYEQALRIPEVIDAGPADHAIGFRRPAAFIGPVEAVELYRQAAEAASLAGSADRAVERVRQAIALEADTGLRAALLRDRLARYLWDAGESDESLRTYQAALGALPSGPSLERARVLGGKARVLMLGGRYAESLAVAEEAASAAHDVGASREAWVAATLRSTSLAFLGRGQEAREAFEGARVLDPSGLAGVEAGPRPSRIVDHIGALLSEATILERAGELGAAADLSLTGQDLAGRLGVASTLGGLAAAVAARRLFEVGRWNDAESLIRTTIAEGIAAPVRDAELYTTLARLATGRGAFIEAEAADRVVEERSDGSMPMPLRGQRFAAEADLALWQRRPGQAREIVDVGLRELSAVEDRHPLLALAALGVRSAADQAQATRDHRAGAEDAAALETASTMLGWVEAYYDPKASGPRETAIALMARADYSRARGEAAPESWAAAASAYERLGERYSWAMAQWRLAEALMLVGDRAGAEVALRPARQVAEDLGAVPLLSEIDALARRARLDLAVNEAKENGGDTVNRSGNDLGLSARELEVLLLLAQGNTNRQIATQLFITEKTAGHHVSNILGKLGVASRLEAAAVAHRSGLDAP